jgi:fructokinase
MRDVVCFGEILWDMFDTGRSDRDAAPARRAIGRDFRRELGGAPANVATGLARLGASVAVVGGVGRDAFGEALVHHLAADGVDVRFVVKLPNRTGLTFVTRDASGEPRFLFYRHDSADLAVRAEHVVPAMGRARWVLVGSSTLMTRELGRATTRFLDLGERAGASVFVDLNVRAHLWPSRGAMERAIARLVRRAALVKASDADLRAVGGGASGLRWLERHAPQATWLVTRGSGVASAIGPHGSVDVPALRARCVDATGAGDAFIAGALATLVAAGAVPWSAAWFDARVWRTALRAGHMMGKKAVSRPGAVAGLVGLDRTRAVVASAASVVNTRRRTP